MQKIRHMLILLVVLLLNNITHLSYAQDITCGTPINISNNPTAHDASPQIDQNYVVWTRQGEDDFEIMLYNIETGEPPINISQNKSYPDVSPRISGQYVVWTTQYDMESTDIWLYNIETGEPAINITETEDSDFFYDMDANFIVWWSTDSDTNQVWLYNIDTGEKRSIYQNTQYNFFYPQIDGRYVVWSDGFQSEVWLYDIEAGGDPINISQTPDLYETHPQISGNYVVAQSSDGRMYDMWVYDIANQIRTDIYQIGVEIPVSIDDQKIVWTGFVDNTFQILLYDIDSGNDPINISQDKTRNNYIPIIVNNYVTWIGMDDTGESRNLWLYNTRTGEAPQAIVSDVDLRLGRDMFGEYIVWNSPVNGDDEIWLYKICPSQ